MEKKYYAFWKYDSAPYLLGGEIEEFKSDGRVKIKGFTGMLFHPVKIVPLATGIKLKKLLDIAEANYSIKYQQIDRELKSVIDKICE